MSQDMEVRQAQDPAVIFKAQVAKTEQEFRAALPAHIPVDRFKRVVMTAVVNNPSLLEADRRSLFESAMKAAQDGLLPDGREGALVIYNTKNNGGWIKRVQWMPMIAGILKKIRNSGELVSISAHVVYSNDEFSYELGDDEKVTHRPALDNRGMPRLLYAIAKLKDGGVYREIMTVADVEKVRTISRARDSGPWMVWWDEMARKTVLRRLSKRLPMSSDIDDLLRRDDRLHDPDVEVSPSIAPFRALATSPEERLKIDLDAIAAGGNGDPPHDPETGEIIIKDTGDDVVTEEMAKQSEALADPTGEKAGALLKTQLAERTAKTNEILAQSMGEQKEIIDKIAASPPQRDGAGAGPIPPETAPASEGRTKLLIDEGRARAIDSPRAFKSWKARLNVADFALVEPHLAAIEKATA